MWTGKHFNTSTGVIFGFLPEVLAVIDDLVYALLWCTGAKVSAEIFVDTPSCLQADLCNAGTSSTLVAMFLCSNVPPKLPIRLVCGNATSALHHHASHQMG